MFVLSNPTPDTHTIWEDAQGILTGAALVALSIQFLRASELITGQIAGLSLLISYPTSLPFGLVFFTLNLPFYILAVRKVGWPFTLKTFAAVGLMSFMAETLPVLVTIDALHPAAGAVVFGILSGTGLLLLFRHGATLGGVGIVALWLQDTHGIKAGHTQLTFDLGVFVLALFLFDWQMVTWSLLGAVVVNFIITINHRRDRYIAK